MFQVAPDPFPPEVHEGCQGRQLLADFLEGVVRRRKLLASRSCFKGIDFRLQPAFDLCRGLGHGVRDAERMEGQRQGFKVLPIRTLYPFPLLHLGLPRFNMRRGLLSARSALRPILLPFKPFLGLLKLLAGLAERAGDGERIALDNLMHEVKAIWYAQTL